jgi:hypothetical protein
MWERPMRKRPAPLRETMEPHDADVQRPLALLSTIQSDAPPLGPGWELAAVFVCATFGPDPRAGRRFGGRGEGT